MTHADPGRPPTVIAAEAHAGASIDVYREFPDPVGERRDVCPERVAGLPDEVSIDSACPTFQRVRYQRRRAARS